MNVTRLFPILDWLPKYDKSQFKGDLASGLTVGVMLIPQGMAYAMIAGLPPIYGLYASTIPLIIYALLGTSRQLAVGPVAMVSLLTAAGIGAISTGGIEVYVGLAIALALLVGLIQFLLGVFRLGFLVNFLSHPVISGFTSAAALIIGLSQLKHLLGVDIERSHHVHEIILSAISQFGAINWATFGVGVAGIALIIAAKRINKAIPGPLLAVVFGILVVWTMGLTGMGVKIVGEIPKGTPNFAIPQIDLDTFQALIPIALTISLVSFMESIAVAKAIQAKHKNYKVIPNQELIALGLANIGGSFFQSYPTTGGFSRTAVNDQSGARTGIASIISAGLILLTLLFLTPLFYYLPKAILASVIMVAVFGLIDFKEVKHLWHTDRTDFLMLLITFLATLSLGIEQGIGVGVVLSLAMIIFKSTRPHYAVLGQVPNSNFYRNIHRFPNLKTNDELLIIRFDSQLYFANTNFFKETIQEEAVKRGENLKAILINAESINSLDSSAVHALEEVWEDYHNNGITIMYSGVKGPVRDVMSKAKLVEKIGAENFFMSVHDGVMAFENQRSNQTETELEPYVLQTDVKDQF